MDQKRRLKVLFNQYPAIIIGIMALLIFVPGLGNVHLFDWDEINFAEASREMLVTGDWLRVYIDYQPFWEKPPLFFWLQAVSMSIFGIGEMAARLPNAVCGALTLMVLFKIGNHLQNARLGYLWALTYAGSILPFLYFKSGIIDPWFNLFIFLSLYFLFRSAEKENSTTENRPFLWPILAGVFAGLAILTKGPVAIILIGTTLGICWIAARFTLFVKPTAILLFTLFSVLIPLLWFGLEIAQNGTWFVEEFIRYQWRLFSTADAGHSGFPGFHLVVLLVGCFPASIFALKNLFQKTTGFYQKDFTAHFRNWMIVLFLVVLIIFSVVQSKIIHYSSLAYFPLTFLAAQTAYQLIAKKQSISRSLKVGLWLIGGLFATVIILIPFLGQHINWLEPLFQKDAFAQANLEAAVSWTGWEIIPGILLLCIMASALKAIRNGQSFTGLMRLFLGNILVLWLVLFFFINKIETYSQRAAIEFFKERQGEKAYVITHGHKSYAHLFYTEKTKPEREESDDKQWLLHGEIDRPIYVVSKINKIHHLESVPDLEELYRKNGFVFFKRSPGKSKNTE